MESVFEATVTRTDEGSVVVMSGTVNRAAKQGLETAYEEASAHPGRILMDFRSVDYINSTGIAVIVGVLAMARAEDREVGAFGLTDHYREVFSITRLSDFMTIYDDETAAVAAG
ncbi:MAG TPA: STAS domain-containing protein [Acidimicrobiia bacterium]|nr:STAS domain-containing protein [Acidimicrobiia bacterium]